jgi:hypothetical protein
MPVEFSVPRETRTQIFKSSEGRAASSPTPVGEGKETTSQQRKKKEEGHFKMKIIFER